MKIKIVLMYKHSYKLISFEFTEKGNCTNKGFKIYFMYTSSTLYNTYLFESGEKVHKVNPGLLLKINFLMPCERFLGGI